MELDGQFFFLGGGGCLPNVGSGSGDIAIIYIEQLMDSEDFRK